MHLFSCRGQSPTSRCFLLCRTEKSVEFSVIEILWDKSLGRAGRRTADTLGRTPCGLLRLRQLLPFRDERMAFTKLVSLPTDGLKQDGIPVKFQERFLPAGKSPHVHGFGGLYTHPFE
jgi:hypothetical protein